MADPQIFEMFWDCAYCDTKALLGKTNRHCPQCGAPQDPTKRYFPPPGKEKEVVANHDYDGADKSCPACATPNGAKANNCRNCGSPLDGSKNVALLGERSNKPPAPPAAPAKKSGWLPKLIGLGAVLMLGTCGVCMMWTKEVTVEVKGHRWARTIDVETLEPTSKNAWCDSMPGGAYNVSHKQEKRSTKKIADGQDCHTKDVDRGDGTFKRENVCTTKYREEPVYDDKCYFTVDQWNKRREVNAKGSALSPAPSWPPFSLSRAGSCVGCEREGPHHEKYEVLVRSNEGKDFECDYGEDTWRKFAIGKSYPMKVRVMTGGADCGSLKP